MSMRASTPAGDRDRGGGRRARVLPRSCGRRRSGRRTWPGDRDRPDRDHERPVRGSGTHRRRLRRARCLHRDGEPGRHGRGLQWSMTFDGLTGPATAAHIHVAPRGQPGPVVVPLCGTVHEPGERHRQRRRRPCSRRIQTGGAYVNVHTDTEPGRRDPRPGRYHRAAPHARSARGRRSRSRRATCGVPTGSFVATVAKEGTTGAVTWRLTFARLTGPARRGAHPHRPGRTGRARRRCALRPVPERPAWKRGSERGDARRAGGGTRLREHPHEAEPGRRDPRAAAGCRAPDRLGDASSSGARFASGRPTRALRAGAARVRSAAPCRLAGRSHTMVSGCRARRRPSSPEPPSSRSSSSSFAAS